MIHMNTSHTVQKLHNFWNHIHFHPTDAIEDDWGRAILDRVATDKAATTVRMYAMLEDIVTRDEQGVLHYDFTLNADFSGFRNFFTLHGIRKPIYNAYVLMRKLGDRLLKNTCENPAFSVLPPPTVGAN